MGDNAKSDRGPKIILLSRDASLANAARGGSPIARHCCVRVTSPYEAAAELLEDHPAALVIDLRCLTPSDLPLVEMARQRKIEVLAVGVLPLGVVTADLSGVRLAARDHLAALLDYPVRDDADPPARHSGSLDAADSESKSRPIAGRPQGEPEPSGDRSPVPVRESARRTDDAPRGDRPDALLTSEELTALLEDE
jgi:hypothetical protein